MGDSERQKVGKYSASEGGAVDLFQRQNAKKHKFILHVQPIAVVRRGRGQKVWGGGRKDNTLRRTKRGLKSPN